MIMSTRPQTSHDDMLAWLLGGKGLGGPAAGYATFQDYNAAVCLPLSAAVKCPPPFDPACVGPAQAAVAACQNAWVTDPASCHNVVCDASGQPAVKFQPYTTPSGQPASAVGINTTSGFVPTAPSVVRQSTPAAPAPVYTPQLSFVNSRGGTSLQVGDTWHISITGAPPNTPVTVTGGSAGVQNTNTMGMTDAAGNFSLSGTFTSDLVGVWSEVWKVGGSPVGSLIAFTVSPAPSSAASAAPAPSTDQTTSGGGPSNTVQIGSWNIPYWGLGLGAAGLLFLIVRSATK